MKKILILTLTLGIFLVGGSLYAASGDLVVNGNLTVSGTVNGSTISSTPVANTIPLRNAAGNLPFRGCKAYYGMAFHFVPAGGASAYPMAAESYDTDSIHDNAVNNTRMTVPAGVTKVRLTYGVGWQWPYLTFVESYLTLNGGIFYAFETRRYNSGDRIFYTATTGVLEVTGGDYFELFVDHNYGSSDVPIHGGQNSTYVIMEIIE